MSETCPSVPLPPDDGLEQLFPLFDSLSRCHRAAREALATVTQRHGMTDSEFHLLWVCQVKSLQAPSQSDLAQALALSPAQVSCLVEQLRQREWITGTRSKVDRRRQVWRVTQQGVAALHGAVVDLQGLAARVNDQLAADARQTLLASLHELFRSLTPTVSQLEEAA